METFRDGYVVNAIIDACYKSIKSGRWEPVRLAFKAPGRPQEAKTRGKQAAGRGKSREAGVAGKAGTGVKAGFVAIKTERLPDGRVKRILKDKATGRIVEEID